MPGFATSRQTLRQRARADAGAGHHQRRRSTSGPSAELMLQHIGHPYASGEPVLRHHVRERAGRRAHVAPVPPRQPQRRARARHGRSFRTRAGLHDVWRRRPHVALQRQRFGAEDADPAPDPLGHQDAAVRRRDARRARPHRRDADFAGTVPAPATSPEQSSEAVVGPYELQDFHLYYISRFGYRPSKVAFLAHAAWGDASEGAWPDTVPDGERRSYDLATICEWLEVFLRRFFQGSQFKRSAMPNGPKVGSGGSLSPRSDWRAPSDSPATVWLEELRAGVPPYSRSRSRGTRRN